jgi:hypothetical protein
MCPSACATPATLAIISPAASFSQVRLAAKNVLAIPYGGSVFALLFFSRTSNFLLN